MKKVYVAGPYSSNNIYGVLNNMRKGMRVSTEVFLLGLAPFCPWLDYQYQLMLREDEDLTIDNYYEYSLAWLEVSDFVLVLPGWEESKGTIAEIARAKELNIPVVYSIENLKEIAK